MDELNNPQPTPPSGYNGLSGKEKLGFLGLVVLALAVIILGFRQTQSNLKSPFNDFIAKHSGGEDTASNSAVASLDTLKTKDTDKDGLSDYDELYTYRTSPYLPDTDSDGITDKTEVTQGTDPNCPKGQNCGAYTLASPDSANTAKATLGNIVGAVPTADQLLLQSLFGSNPDPKAMREFLIKQGMDKKVLDKINDAELLKTFQESITPSQTVVNPADVGALTPADLASLEKMTAQDVRNLLIKQGAKAEELKKISDEELMKIFKESLKQ